MSREFKFALFDILLFPIRIPLALIVIGGDLANKLNDSINTLIVECIDKK